MSARVAKARWSEGRIRLGLLGLCLAVAWLGMGIRLYQVQVLNASQLAEAGVGQRQTEKVLLPQRGNIFDRNGDPMAMTVDSRSIYLRPPEITQPVYVAQQVGGLLGVPAEGLLESIESGEQFVYVKRQVELNRAEEVLSLNLAGVHAHEEPKRVYPTGSVASHVLGFVNIDGVGSEGIEYEFESDLRGTPGVFSFESAPGGVPIPWAPSHATPAVPGEDLVSTVDLPVQYSAEAACQETLRVTGGTGCWIVAMEVETGAVLAIAGAPAFDPASRVSADGSGFSNFAVRGMYEPGSTMKLISVAGAIEDGVVGPSTVIGAVADQIELRPGACKSDTDEVFGCYSDFERHETHDMAVADVFRQSSNVGTIKIAQMMSRDQLFFYLKAFGLGELTGLDYPGEARGLINLDESCQTCPASSAIGYGVAVTAVQMAAAYGAVGNDGVWLQPHLLSTTHGLDGRTATTPVASHRAVSVETAAVMRSLLSEVVEAGTGISAQVPGYLVGGKTGTANKLGEDGRYTDITMASFVGLAPIDDPKVVVAVVVDSPAWEYRTGGLAAAPAFSAVMEQALHRLGVTPDAASG
ncbi:MAG TPA: penicillin-binding protein 2 [Acidimicrobiia bacterium]|nr:penicillin-binding protein 2 [Acidimicrobiia bacterium]